MRIAFFVNDVQMEKESFTTTRLALAAVRREHDVFYIDAEHFHLDDEELKAGAFAAPAGIDDRDVLLEAIRLEDAREQVSVEGLDVLMLRNNPGDTLDRPWAHDTGVIFGGVAVSRGVIVLNDPGGSYKALNKMYLATVPTEIRPRTLITRDAEEIKRFIDEHDGLAILKPLSGFGGQNVFLVNPDEGANVNQMIDAVKRDGYVIVQEYLPSAEEGDVRLILVNGHPLEVDGEVAAFRRVPAEEDLRSNMAAGGTPEAVEMNDDLMRVADVIRPKLVEDGMFFVGLDIVKDKLIELNVFSPGGLGSPEKLTGVDFAPSVIAAIERKVTTAADNGSLSNRQLATL
jgi:glutathione synthase